MSFSSFAQEGGPFAHLAPVASAPPVESPEQQPAPVEPQKPEPIGDNAKLGYSDKPVMTEEEQKRIIAASAAKLVPFDDSAIRDEATKTERARCAAIFAAPQAASNVQAAAQLAFQTDLSAEQAVNLLVSLGAPATAQAAKRSLTEQMQTVPAIDVGLASEAPQADAKSERQRAVDFIMAAGDKVNAA